MWLWALVFLFAAPFPTGQAGARVQEGLTALERNDLAKAQTSFEEATRLSPQHAGTWLLLAQTYAKQKNQPSALAAAGKAETLGGDDPQILQSLANFYVALIPDYPKAAALGARYAERSPQDVTAWRRLAGFCLSVGLVDQAIAASLRGLRVDDSPELHSLLGAAYVQRKDWDKAIAELKTALAMNRFDEGAQFRLAQAYLIQQNFASAAVVLEDARKTFDKSPQIELALGVAYYGLRRFPEAVGQFLKTMRLAPDVPQPYVFLGRILDHAADLLPEITDRFTQFQNRNPQSYLGYLLHAKVVIAQLPRGGFPSEAQAALDLVRKSLALKEDVAETHFQLGVLLDRKREYADAATHLERSAALSPLDSAVHFQLARVYERLGRKEEAAKQLELHEKLSEQENATGGPAMVLDPPANSPAASRTK